MKPRISVLTLGVEDLAKAVEFYRDGLGLSTEGIVGEEFEFGAVAFFDLQSGLRLALWPRKSIARDTGLSLNGSFIPPITIGHNVSTQEEVNQIMALAENAGAKILKPASQTFRGGYAGYFQDPDQYIWEIVYNPDFIP